VHYLCITVEATFPATGLNLRFTGSAETVTPPAPLLPSSTSLFSHFDPFFVGHFPPPMMESFEIVAPHSVPIKYGVSDTSVSTDCNNCTSHETPSDQGIANLMAELWLANEKFDTEEVRQERIDQENARQGRQIWPFTSRWKNGGNDLIRIHT
jgi:hypothetical protein